MKFSLEVTTRKGFKGVLMAPFLLKRPVEFESFAEADQHAEKLRHGDEALVSVLRFQDHTLDKDEMPEVVRVVVVEEGA